MQGEPHSAGPNAAPGGSDGGSDAVAGGAAGGADDNALVAALTRGDKGALARLYDRHASLLLALGLRILGDRTLAEDVVHDVFLEAWHHAADFDPDRGTVRAWLVTRMRSRALDRRASVVRQARLADEVKREIGDEPPATNPGAASPLDGERVRSQIAGLAPELAIVIALAYFDGLSSSEIAVRLAIPIGTVKSRTARALAVLREGLADLGASE